MLKEIKKDTAVLVSEQNASLTLKVSDRTYVMELGEIRLSGKADEVMANPEVKRAYLGI